MIAKDENALICDLAETYNIYDYKSLPARTVAIFSVGLRDDSRIKMKMSGAKVKTETLLLASIADRIGGMLWGPGDKGQRPPSIVDALYGIESKDESNSEVVSFKSAKDFKTAKARIVNSKKGGK